MNNEQLLQNLQFNQLSLGDSTLFEANRTDTSLKLQPSSVPLACNKFMPMGIRVIVDLPYTQDEGTPLFCIRLTPTWYTPMEIASLCDATTIALYQQYLTSLPVFLPYTGGSTQYTFVESDKTDAPVRVSYYGDPPPICRYSRVHRHNTGSLKYQIVSTPGSVTHGYLQYSVLRGVKWPMSVSQVNHRIPLNTYKPDFSSTYDNFANTKLSSEGFIELEIPRTTSTGVKDSASDLFSMTNTYEPVGYDYLMVYSKGTMSSLSQTQMVFELNIAGGDDFQMYTPLPISTSFRNFWGAVDIYNLGNLYANNVYLNPGLTFPSGLKKYQQLFNADGSLKPYSTKNAKDYQIRAVCDKSNLETAKCPKVYTAKNTTPKPPVTTKAKS